MWTSSISIERINEIIDAEIEAAKAFNQPLMAMGMIQIRKLLNDELARENDR